MQLHCANEALAHGLSRDRTIRAIFAGNSYTYYDDIPWITWKLSSSVKQDKALEVKMISPPGVTHEYHWRSGEVVALLKQISWDFVVLQEQSVQSIERPKLMRQYAELFDSEIKRASASMVFLLTWPRQQRPENFGIITNNYPDIAHDLKGIVAPVGIVWRIVLKEGPSLQLYHEDGSHPGPIGSYIAGCVLYSVFYGKSPAGLPRELYSVAKDGRHVKIGKLNRSDSDLIDEIVWRIVQCFLPLKP